MRALLFIISVAPTVFALSACGHSDPPVRRYHTRGLVTEATVDGNDLNVAIHHEAVAAFEGRDGKQTSMASMKMLFGVAKDVPKSLFQQGAKLAFDFDVRWSKRPTLLIVKAEPLASDTQLVLDENEHH